MRRHRFLTVAAAIFFLATVPGYGQFGLARNKDKDKDAERLQKETERDQKNQRAYDKIKAYSTDKYATDPDFHDEVETRYADILRDHTAIAFEKNTHRGSKIYAVNEDRFRLNDETDGIYDNLLVQDRINRIGQSLVPKDSDRVFAFRLTADPTPGAETLATGTIYVTTGMVSLLDNEAQLAYVLAHEMAHVQLEHWKQKSMMEVGLEAYNNDQTKKAERIGVIAGIAGGLTGGIATKSVAAGLGAGLATGGLGYLAGELLNRKMVVNWDRAQEDEADKMAFKAMLDAQYDVREVPKLYAIVENVVVRDSRATLGFLGEKNRVKERKEQANNLIANAYKADIEAQLKGKGFQGDSAGYRNLMAELKRDNGIMAYYNDMFELARRNLDETVAIRDNDPAAQYYYGKVLETIGRTPEDRKNAQQAYVKAAQFDRQQENFGSHLHQALILLSDENNRNNATLTKELDTYVTDYVRYQLEYSKSMLLPPNINTITEYMRLYGAADWQPNIPAEASTLHLTENQLPKNPDAPKPATQTAPTTPAASKVPCKPGMTAAQCATAAATAGAKALINK